MSTVDCHLLRCEGPVTHYLPWHRDEPLPRCFIDGAPTEIHVRDTWCVPWIWDDVMRRFAESCWTPRP